MDFRFLANQLFHFAFSEWCLVVLLGAAWISPETVESIYPGFIASLPVLFVAEFILGHAAVGFAVPLQFEGALRVVHVNAGWSGRFVDHPEILIFLLMLYFACIPWLERNIFPKVTRLFDR